MATLPLTFVVGEAAHAQLTVLGHAPVVAGVPFQLEVRVLDVYGNTLTEALHYAHLGVCGRTTQQGLQAERQRLQLEHDELLYELSALQALEEAIPVDRAARPRAKERAGAADTERVR